MIAFIFEGTEHSSGETSCAEFLSQISTVTGNDSSPVEGTVTAVLGEVPSTVKPGFDHLQL